MGIKTVFNPLGGTSGRGKYSGEGWMNQWSYSISGNNIIIRNRTEFEAIPPWVTSYSGNYILRNGQSSIIDFSGTDLNSIAFAVSGYGNITLTNINSVNTESYINLVWTGSTIYSCNIENSLHRDLTIYFPNDIYDRSLNINNSVISNYLDIHPIQGRTKVNIKTTNSILNCSVQITNCNFSGTSNETSFSCNGGTFNLTNCYSRTSKFSLGNNVGICYLSVYNETSSGYCYIYYANTEGNIFIRGGNSNCLRIYVYNKYINGVNTPIWRYNSLYGRYIVQSMGKAPW